MVYAKNITGIVENEEQSFCGDSFWVSYWQRNFASLSIEKIECSTDNNKLSVMIGVHPASKSLETWQTIWQYEWEAEGKVYFGDEEIGTFDIREPTYPGDSIDLYSYGIYTYLLPWEITAPVMVTVVAHATIFIEEDDFYASCDFYGYEFLKPLNNTTATPNNTSTTPSNTSTTISYTSTTPGDTSTNETTYISILLGFIGLSMVIRIGYQRYGTRLFDRRR